MPLLAVDDLRLAIGTAPVLQGLSFTVDAGTTVALVGESGSGKTMTALSIMRLLPPAAAATGRVLLDGFDLLAASQAEMNDRRGRALGMVFQEPMTALNPLKTIGAQIAETVTAHHGASRADAAAIAREALERVGLTAARVPPDRYPHELSGGERQRVVVAIATVLKPPLIIADEPTSALDVASQAIVLDLLRRLVREDGCGLLLISHDLAAVAAMADRLLVMHKGTIVERGDAPAIFRSLRHPYSQALLAAATYRPARGPLAPPAKAGSVALLDVQGLVREYRVGGMFGTGHHRVLDGVSFIIRDGENVALVGESGSGKSTLARVVLGLDPPQAGRVAIRGSDFFSSRGAALRDLRRSVQAVFQDPYGSFDPRSRVWRLVAEPLALEADRPSAAEQRKRVDAMLTAVGLAASVGDRFPHEFSGGERQRLAVARALITRPALVVLDEPVSALDLSVRGAILDLLAEAGRRFGVSYLFISHDLSIVRAVATRVLVLHNGKIVEQGDPDELFAHPQHPYTATLVAATPSIARALSARDRRS